LGVRGGAQRFDGVSNLERVQFCVIL